MSNFISRIFASSKPSDKATTTISPLAPGQAEGNISFLVHSRQYQTHLKNLKRDILKEMTNLVPTIVGESPQNTDTRLESAIAMAIHELVASKGYAALTNEPDENMLFMGLETELRKANQDPETSARWADSIAKAAALKTKTTERR